MTLIPADWWFTGKVWKQHVVMSGSVNTSPSMKPTLIMQVAARNAFWLLPDMVFQIEFLAV